MTAVSFNSNSLQTANIITSDIDHYDPPEKEVAIYQVAHANRSKAAYSQYTKKKIVLSGTLVADTKTEFEQLIDSFKGFLTGSEKYLDIEHGGSTRRYLATVVGRPSIPRPGGLLYSPFNVQFECSIPFGFDTTTTNLANVTGATASINNSTFTVGGTAEVQYPIIEITINSGTNMADGTLSVSNNNNGQVCEITRTFLAGDVIRLDPYFGSVTVNDDEVDYSGAVPVFAKGSGGISISDTFNTRNIDYTVDQQRYWL